MGRLITNPFVVFVGEGGDSGNSISNENGGGATVAALEAGDPADFFDGNGDQISNGATWVGTQGACIVTEGAGDTVKVTAPNVNDFASVVDGTIAFMDILGVAQDDTFYVVVERVSGNTDNDEVTLVGWTWSGDLASTGHTCDINVGGIVTDKLSEAADGTFIALVTAANTSCTVLVQKDETFSADVTLSAGGGTASTMLRFLGVDSSWARVVPTRTSIGGGKANGPLKIDENHMPTITLELNAQFITNVNFLQLDGLYFTGNDSSGNGLVGTISGDWITVSNCVIRNINNTAGCLALRLDNNAIIDNCDFFSEGATSNTFCVSTDTGTSVSHCRFVNESSSATSRGVILNTGVVSDCLFHNMAGIGVDFDQTTVPIGVVQHCTFESVATCIVIVNNDISALFSFNNNIVANCTTFIDNLHATNLNIFAAYNQIFNVTNSYDKCSGELGFQDLTSDPKFVNAGLNDYNLEADSPAKNTSSMLTNRGAMSDEEAGGNGGGLIVHPGMNGGINA